MQSQAAPSTSAPWTISKVIGWATSYLRTHTIDSPRATAEILLAHALKYERIDLYLNYDKPLVAEELNTFKGFIKRRIRREPVAYILGLKEFWSLELEVTPDVLIPRPETECLVETALDLLGKDPLSPSKRILDLGTGSGAIVLALASRLPRNVYFASDRMVKAVALARRNAGRHHLANIHFFAGDWLSALNPNRAGLDMVVSNPPYIPRPAIAALQPEIHKFEPVSALDGDTDGLACLREIIGNAHRYLQPDGVLLMEIGHDQQDDVRKIVSQNGCYEAFRVTKDYSGYDRVAQMRARR